MTLEELNAIVDGVSKPFREQLDAANQRIAQLEQRFLSIPVLAPIDVEAIAERAAALIPVPQPRAEDWLEWFDKNKQGIRDAIHAVIPLPEKGEPGKDAEPVDRSEIVAEVLRQIPAPVNGKDGKDGNQGERGLPGESIQGPKGDSGERGADGKDAVLPDIDAMVQRAFEIGFARTAVDIQRQAQEMFQRAIDKMPVPKDGKDGLSAEDFNLEHDGDGTVKFSLKRGDLDKSWDIRFPRQKYRGVFKEGDSYREGDTVTFGGSQFTAMVDDVTEKPGTGTGWQLTVKRGRDGRDGVMKPPPPEGPVKL